MLPTRLVSCFAVLAVVGAVAASAQSNAYIPLDDSHLPLFEYLVARGEVADPSPGVRPFRRIDALRSLAHAALDTATQAGRIAARLRSAWAPRDSLASWELQPRAGIDAFTSPRRDLLHPVGDSTRASLFADIGGIMEAGIFAIGVRVGADNRLMHDPDWLARASPSLPTKLLAYRTVEGWVSASLRALQVHYGQIDRAWGPAGEPGLALANTETYARPDLALHASSHRLTAWMLVSGLATERDTLAGVHTRAFMAHRLAWQPSRAVALAAWETMLVSDATGAWARALGASLYPFAAARLGGRFADRNTVVGADADIRAGAIDAAAQVAVDFPSTTSASLNSRSGMIVVLRGPLRTFAAWQASYSRIGSAMYQSGPVDGAPVQTFTDHNVGIVRLFPDNRRARLQVIVPWREAWVVIPEMVLQDQGPARITDADSAAHAPFAAVEHLVELGASVRGESGKLRIDATGGLQHVTNTDNQPGISRTRLEFHVVVTVGLHFGGALR